MENIMNFFTEAPTLVEAYYVIIAICLLGIFIFTFLPESIALKLFIPYRLISHRSFLHKKEQREYDWASALRKQSILLLAAAFLSVLILLFTSFYGRIVAKVGLGILAVLFIGGGIWIDPARD